AAPDVVQQQIGEERDGDAIEQGVRAWPGRQRGRVARAASDGAEDALAIPGRLVNRTASDRRQELHEAGEVVDASAAGAWIADVFGLRMRVAHAHPLVRDPNRD